MKKIIPLNWATVLLEIQWKMFPTLKNIGLKDDELYSNIRVTLGSLNNKSEIDKFLELIQICIEKF